MTAAATALGTHAPRDRILDAAARLFYERGINSVSVDDVAHAAQSNKMTLYRHFRSKEGLVVAWLHATAQKARAKWEEVEDRNADPVARLHGLGRLMVDEISEWMRGCPFGNSLAELSDPAHPAHAIIRDYFSFQRAWLERACTQAGFAEPAGAADALFYIVRGTSSGLVIDDPHAFARREARALDMVIASAGRAAALPRAFRPIGRPTRRPRRQ